MNANCSDIEESDVHNRTQMSHDGCFIINRKKNRDLLNKRKDINEF